MLSNRVIIKTLVFLRVEYSVFREKMGDHIFEFWQFHEQLKMIGPSKGKSGSLHTGRRIKTNRQTRGEGGREKEGLQIWVPEFHLWPDTEKKTKLD